MGNAVGSYDKGLVLDILRLLDQDKCQQALMAWHNHRQDTTELCTPCPYEQTLKGRNNCCQCLEAQLRTLSLYQHGGGHFEALLIEGARKLQAYGYGIGVAGDLTDTNTPN